jgi:hypothetical protein
LIRSGRVPLSTCRCNNDFQCLNVNSIALIGFQGLMLQALSEKHNSFLRPLKKKGFKEERVTTIGLYDIGKSHDPGIQQEPPQIVIRVCVAMFAKTYHLAMLSLIGGYLGQLGP